MNITCCRAPRGPEMRDVDVLPAPAPMHPFVDPQAGGLFQSVPGGAPLPAKWNFVGDGHGSYTKAQGYGFVGEGQGDWQQVEVEVDDGRTVRPLCWVMLTLFCLTAVFTMVFCFVVFSTTTTSTSTAVGLAEFNLAKESCLSFYNAEQQGYCCQRYSLLCGGSREGGSANSNDAERSFLSDHAGRLSGSQAKRHFGEFPATSSAPASAATAATPSSSKSTTSAPAVVASAPPDRHCGHPDKLTLEQKAWCCDHEGVACKTTSTREPTTTLMLYNCAAGKVRDWSFSKQDWCCKHRDLCGDIGEA